MVDVGGDEISIQLLGPQYASLPNLRLRAYNAIDKSHQLSRNNPRLKLGFLAT